MMVRLSKLLVRGGALVAELVVATYRNLARSSLYYVVQSGEVSERESIQLYV